MIKLGNLVRDIISGFSGVATARTEWMYGCSRICIEPQHLHEGKPIEAQWFDEQRVVLVEERAPEVSPASKAKTGGPQRDPSRSAGRP